VTTLDIVRSNTFVGELKGIDPALVEVPVVGGHAGITILPLLSQVKPAMTFTADQISALTSRIQDAGTEVVKAKAGKGSATLSMAFAAARMGDSCLKGLCGVESVECAYVASSVTELPFFASKVTLGPEGVAEVHGLGALSDFEAEGVKKLVPELKKQITKGVEFASK
jgi:malate dehydrogenase